MEHFVADLVYERRKFFGWLHPGKQRDLAAVRIDLSLVQFARSSSIPLPAIAQTRTAVRGIRSRRLALR